MGPPAAGALSSLALLPNRFNDDEVEVDVVRHGAGVDLADGEKADVARGEAA